MMRFSRRRSFVPLVVFSFVVISVAGFVSQDVTGGVPLAAQVTVQGPPPPTPSSENPPPRATPPPAPDTKAYTDATRITDPDKKVEALQKFLEDFPESSRKTAAHLAIFDTLVKERSDRHEQILQHADAIIDGAPEGSKASSFSRVATRLVDANLMLEEAEKFATEGLEVFEREETRRVQRSRATHLATLGRIRIKQGRISEAETALKDAFAANPEIPAAAVGLAELAEKKGDDRAALDYWLTAALTGRLSADDRQRFEGLYRKVHGSLDTLDSTLDAKYKGAYPPSIHPEPYTPSPARTTRVVLAEVFTGAACPPCVSVDLGFDGALERYSRHDVAVLMYHVHIPGPDPLTTKLTDDRRNWYRVTGVPNFAVDGELDNRGGGGRDAAKAAYDRIVSKLDKALERVPGAELALAASLEGKTIRVKATPSKIEAVDEEVMLQIALVEEMLGYSGENGVRFHPMVVRYLAQSDKGGFPVKRGEAAPAEYVFDLEKITAEHKAYLDDYEVNGRHGKITFSRKPVQMNLANLSVVAFLQEAKSRKVLQSAYVKVGAGTTTSAPER